MQKKVKQSVKYRIKSFGYEESLDPRLVFTLEEPGACGEMRRFAEEIASSYKLRRDFSITDAALILDVAEREQDFPRSP